MLLITLVQRLYDRLDRYATQRLTQDQLAHLDDRLLRDIGLRREGDRILPLGGAGAATAPVAPASRTPAPLAAGRALPLGDVLVEGPPARGD